jgi:hypothetical protein
MAIVDERGRLFGRLNLADSVLVVLFLILLPLGYGSWLLFRSPPARLTAVEPARITAAPVFRLVLRGQDLRPYMRASLGSIQAFNFLFQSSTSAEVEFHNVPMGVYDVVLYDYEKERSRLPQAVTVAPSPIPDTQVIVVGSFGNVTDAQVAQVKPGLSIAGFGEIVEVGRPDQPSTRVFAGSKTVEVKDPPSVRLPVAIRAGCTIRSREGHPVCSVGEVDVQPGALFMLATDFGQLTFQVDQVRALTPLEAMRVVVRFANEPRLLSMIRRGDVEIGKVENPLASGATVVEVSSPRPDLREVVFQLAAQREADGWIYRSEPVRVGTPFVFRTPMYELTGTVLTLEKSTASPGSTDQNK